MDGYSNQHTSEIELLLRISEYFLRHRNFDRCRKYARRARKRDPHDPRVHQILAVASVIEASQTLVCSNQKPEWYSILGLNRYTPDSQLIRSHFKDLLLALNPARNPFSFTKDAFKLVRDAFAVLGDPFRKSLYDDKLRLFESLAGGKTREEEEERIDDATFWTVCPYCYYVYEYSKVYEDCCLRCQNEKCRRGFHAVAVGLPPPREVVEKGEYQCFGFFPLGMGQGSWTPFGSMGVKEEVGDADVHPIQVSDDGGASSDEFGRKFGGGDTGEGHAEDLMCGSKSYAKELPKTDVPNVVKLAAKRRKSVVARNSKKLMGKGTRVNREEMGSSALE